MFRRREQHVADLIMRNLRMKGIETPLLQRRLVAAWPIVAGPTVDSYTTNVEIINQTLFVSLSSPALRADLSMRRQQLVAMLNAHVGAQIISDIRFR